MTAAQPGRDRNPARTPRRIFVGINVAAALLASIAPALAQQHVGPDVDLRMEAPIGARQPRPSDLPPKVLQDEKHLPADQNGVDLDASLSICRGC
jgi:hypothetical protein